MLAPKIQYSFVQSQNIRVLQMNHHTFLVVDIDIPYMLKKVSILILQQACFMKTKNIPSPNQQTSFYINGFVRIKIFEKLFLNCVTYFQINTKDISDIRLFIEPKINFVQDKFSLSIVAQNRYNSMPYLLNNKNDVLSYLLLTINLFE